MSPNLPDTAFSLCRAVFVLCAQPVSRVHSYKMCGFCVFHETSQKCVDKWTEMQYC